MELSEIGRHDDCATMRPNEMKEEAGDVVGDDVDDERCKSMLTW